MKKVWDNDHYHQVCPACKYTYDQYFDATKNYNMNGDKEPFMSVENPISYFHGSSFEALREDTLYICPACGTLHIEVY